VIPEEGRAPAWLGDGGSIEADISRMEEFATKLLEEVEKDYIPQLAYIDDDVTVELPPVNVAFRELFSFLTTHRESQQNTNDLVHFFRDATGGFATAAHEVSARYANIDAFAAAKVTEVDAALDKTMAARGAASGGTTGATPSDSGAPAGSEVW
jgi:hypothetical protein